MITLKINLDECDIPRFIDLIQGCSQDLDELSDDEIESELLRDISALRERRVDSK